MSNAIALAKKLEREHGFNQPQAEGIAQAIHEHESEHFATKADIAALKTDIAELKTELKTEVAALKTDVAELRTELKTEVAGLKTDVAELRTELKTDIAQMQVKLMTWTTVLAGIIIAVLKLT